MTKMYLVGDIEGWYTGMECQTRILQFANCEDLAMISLLVMISCLGYAFIKGKTTHFRK